MKFGVNSINVSEAERSDTAVRGMVEPSSDAGSERRFTARQWYVLMIITAIYACHALDRAVIGVVIEPMKADLKLDDTKVGVVVGLGYGVAFALAALPMGMLIDRANRVRLLSGMVVVWSAFTALAGAAQGFAGLVFARAGVGAAEAGGQPASLSILSDYFPSNRRATALGILYFGAAVGYALSNIVGGVVTHAYGWRTAFFLAGIPGVLLGILLVCTVREPAGAKGENGRAAKAPAVTAVLAYAMRNPVIMHISAAMVLAAFSVTIVMMWTVPLLMREHGFNVAEAGLIAAFAGGFSQALGAVVSGALTDRLSNSAPHRIVIVPVIGTAVSMPLIIAICFIPSAWGAAGLFILAGFVLSSWTAAGYAALLGQLPDRMRGTTLSCLQIGCSFIGASMGPFLVGVLSDRIGGTHSLAWAMSICSLAALWSAAHFLLGGRAIRRGSHHQQAISID